MDITDIINGLSRVENKTIQGVRTLADTTALKAQAQAQSNAPWTDRTGQARQRLKGSAEHYMGFSRVELSHGVDYGIYLEYCNEGKYAIVEETIEKLAPEATKALAKVMEG